MCNKAGHVALDYTYGTSVTGFDPRTAGDSACIVVWGANPSASGPHVDEHWLGTATAEVIVVDPVRTPTAAAADLHLQPFPGTDAALAFGLLHVIARDGLLDRPFLDEHATGWDEVEPLLADCDPQRTEAVTGVPADAGRAGGARVYGGGPSLLWIGQGLQRQPTGGNVVRAIGMLPAATGNLGRAGAGVLYLNDHLEIDGDRLAGAHLGTAPDPVSHMDVASWLEDPERTQALITWNINIAASNPEQARLRAALEREDLFTVVVDLFATDTADLADFVLPAASFLEFDDLMRLLLRPLRCRPRRKAQEPLGESLPNQEIFRRLAAAMGFEEPELQESDEEVIAGLLAESGVVSSFAELAAVGTVPLTAEPVDPVRRPRVPDARAAGSSSPRRRPRPTATPGCRCRWPTGHRRPGTCGCSAPPRRG